MYSALTKCNWGWLSAHCACVKVWEGTHTCLTVQFSHCTVCSLHIHALTHTCVRAPSGTNFKEIQLIELTSLFPCCVQACTHTHMLHTPALKYAATEAFEKVLKNAQTWTHTHTCTHTQIQKYLCVWFHRKSWLLKTYRTLAKQLASTSSDGSLCTLYSVKKKKNSKKTWKGSFFSLLWLQAETK